MQSYETPDAQRIGGISFWALGSKPLFCLFAEQGCGAREIIERHNRAGLKKHRAGHAKRAPLARNLAPDDGVGIKLFS